MKGIRIISFCTDLNSSDEGPCKGWRNFELKYQTERPTAEVAEVMMPADANPEYYNLQGQKVAAPEEGGIYIVKRGAKANKEVYRR